jgi:hypothetical protein
VNALATAFEGMASLNTPVVDDLENGLKDYIDSLGDATSEKDVTSAW